MPKDGSQFFARQLFKSVACAAIAAIAFLAIGCSPGGNEVRIDGSSTVYPITEVVAVAFTDQDNKFRVSIGQGGTGSGMNKFTAGEIDICNASRRMKPGEAAKCQEAGIEFTEFSVAYDGIAIVVNKDNDWCESLTVDQLKEIWRPESPIKKWSDLNAGWPEKEIKLFGPGHNSGTFQYFTDEIVGEEGASRSDYSPNEDDNLLVSGVKNDKYALAYFGYAYYEGNKDILSLVGVDSGDGNVVKPSLVTVRDNVYKPLSRPLYIYLRHESLSKPGVYEFVDFYLNHAAQLAEKVSYVPLDDEKTRSNIDTLSVISASEQSE